MKKTNKYSITSNIAKLLKHLKELGDIQRRLATPILLHLMPTNRCNLSCPTCCFADANKLPKQELDIKETKEILKQFKRLGTKAVENTGFGDPTCYTYINELIKIEHKLGFKIGMNTNGYLGKKITEWSKLTWVRLSMNTLDFYPVEKAYPLDYIRQKAPKLKITGCYVWNEKGKKNLPTVIKFAEKEKIPVRVVPNCISSDKEIKKQIKLIKKLIPETSKYVFVSDFNIDTGKRENLKCYMHLIKPALAPNGYIYSCPSSELSLENGTILNDQFKVCKGIDVYKFYRSKKAFKIKEHSCSYCKYKKQNELLHDLLIETENNEFA